MAASMEAGTETSETDVATEILGLLEGKDVFEATKNHLKTIQTPSVREENKRAENYLRWARHKNDLKIVCADVPIAVLPNGTEGELLDVKVFTKRGPDDDIYDNNKDIRDRVARGNCFMRIGSGPDNGIKCVLQGMKKFTGGLGDDDDRETGDNLTWQRYFTKKLEETETVVATRKANGEAAHLSCVLIGGEYVLCGGSKNVHMLFRKKSDIGRYAEPRFRIAREICEIVIDILDQMDQDKKLRLLKFLVFSRYTAIFEILSPLHQHVEDLSYLTSPMLQFITWTAVELESTEDGSLGVIPPHVGIEIARALGLHTIDYEVLPMSDLDKRMKQIRKGYQYEGEVLYFLDSSNTVIGLLKKKTVWYIMCRAIREKLKGASKSSEKNPSTYSVTTTLRKVEQRMNEIQVWLGLDDKTVQTWKTLGGKFIRWTMNDFEKGNITANDIADLFPVIWSRFLKETGETDNFSDISCNEFATDR